MTPKVMTAMVALGTVAAVVRGGVSATAGSAASRRAVTCPTHYKRPAFTDYPALHRVMVPRKPTRMLVCRYAGLNAKDPQALQGSGVIPPGERLHRVVRAYNRLPKPHSGPIACPADDGREITMQFRYRHRPKAFVRQDVTGCRIGTNGHRTVTALNPRGRRLFRLLRRLSGA